MDTTHKNNITKTGKELFGKNKRALTIALIAIVVLLFGFTIYDKFVPKPGPQPKIGYNFDAQAKLINKIENRKALSDNDVVAKQEILSLLPEGQTSGVVYQEPTFRVEYVKSADLFVVEILSVDFADSKNRATEWFLAQGLSQNGVCDAPIQFYINENVKEILNKAKIKFNPLPPGC